MLRFGAVQHHVHAAVVPLSVNRKGIGLNDLVQQA